MPRIKDPCQIHRSGQFLVQPIPHALVGDIGLCAGMSMTKEKATGGDEQA